MNTAGLEMGVFVLGKLDYGRFMNVTQSLRLLHSASHGLVLLLCLGISGRLIRRGDAAQNWERSRVWSLKEERKRY